MQLKLSQAFLVLSITLFLTIPFLSGALYGQPFTRDTDFQNILTGAAIARDGKLRHLYDITTQYDYQNQIIKPRLSLGILPFRALPVTAVLFMPLAYLTQTTAFIVQNGISCIILLAFFVYFYVDFFKRASISTSAEQIRLNLLLGLAFLFQPIWFNLYSGQIAVFISAFIWLAYIFYVKQKYLAAGLALGFLLLKINFLLFVPIFFLLVRDKNKLIPLAKGFVFSFTGLFLLSMLLYGYNFPLDYFIFLLSTESLTFGTNPAINVNVGAVLTYLFVNKYTFVQAYFTTVINLITLVILGLSILIRKPKLAPEYIFTIASLGTVLLNVHTMPVDLVVLFLPLLFAIFRKNYLVVFAFLFVPFFTDALVLVPILVFFVLMLYFLFIKGSKYRDIQF